MDKSAKLKMFEMRLNGATLEEIGDAYGITRERVRQILSGIVARGAAIERGCKDVIYPNISTWMRHNNISMGEMWVKLGNKPAPSGAVKISKLLHGDAKFGLRIGQIKKILEITEMTFEEAFSEKEREEN